MRPDEEERIKDLVAWICIEQDLAKFTDHVEELNNILQAKKQRLSHKAEEASKSA